MGPRDVSSSDHRRELSEICSHCAGRRLWEVIWAGPCQPAALSVFCAPCLQSALAPVPARTPRPLITAIRARTSLLSPQSSLTSFRSSISSQAQTHSPCKDPTHHVSLPCHPPLAQLQTSVRPASSSSLSAPGKPGVAGGNITNMQFVSHDKDKVTTVSINCIMTLSVFLKSAFCPL